MKSSMRIANESCTRQSLRRRYPLPRTVSMTTAAMRQACWRRERTTASTTLLPPEISVPPYVEQQLLSGNSSALPRPQIDLQDSEIERRERQCVRL